MPPPRHPVTAASATTEEEHATPPPSSIGERQSEPAQPAQDPAQPPPATRQPAPSAGTASAGTKAQRRPASQEKSVEQASTPIKPVTLYVSDAQSDFLEQVRIAGLMERVDLSRSAVVRLALSRLQQDMSVEEIKRHLISQPTDPTRTGRKRR
jgi:hypothetical protein